NGGFVTRGLQCPADNELCNGVNCCDIGRVWINSTKQLKKQKHELLMQWIPNGTEAMNREHKYSLENGIATHYFWNSRRHAVAVLMRALYPVDRVP
ncbi:hypothetical protein M514_22809, partial [Trichuris suis]